MSDAAQLETKRAVLDARLRALGQDVGRLFRWGGFRISRLGSAPNARRNMLAVIADSASLARTHLDDAIAFAREQQIPLKVVETRELSNPDYARNDSQRCFHCKDELFTVMEAFRAEHGFDSIAYGVNLDDQGDFRPGQQAARDHHVAAHCWTPVLPTGHPRPGARWRTSSLGEARICMSFLANRIWPPCYPRGASLSIEQGEDALRALGFRQYRVRHHGEIVRIEIAREELSRALAPAMAAEFTRIFKALGFKFVTLDLEGFRSGSMNTLLPADQLVKRPA